MILWAHYGESSFSQSRIDSVKKIIAGCEPSNEQDVLLGVCFMKKFESCGRGRIQIYSQIYCYAPFSVAPLLPV